MTIKPAELPAHTKRFVVWQNDSSGGTLVYLVGYCPDTLAYYMGMFLDAQKYVADVDPNTAICGKVTKSISCKSHTLCLINVSGPKREIETFKECKWEDLRIDAY